MQIYTIKTFLSSKYENRNFLKKFWYLKAVNVKLDLSMKEIKITRINKIGTIRILPCLDFKKKMICIYENKSMIFILA